MLLCRECRAFKRELVRPRWVIPRAPREAGRRRFARCCIRLPGFRLLVGGREVQRYRDVGRYPPMVAYRSGDGYGLAHYRRGWVGGDAYDRRDEFGRNQAVGELGRRVAGCGIAVKQQLRPQRVAAHVVVAGVPSERNPRRFSRRNTRRLPFRRFVIRWKRELDGDIDGDRTVVAHVHPDLHRLALHRGSVGIRADTDY